MPRIFRLLLGLVCLCLSSCVLQTHERALDMAKEYEAVVLLQNAVYQKGNRLFVKAVRTTVRRSEREVWDCPLLHAIGTPAERSGVYTIVPGAPVKPLYREFSLLYGHKPFDVCWFAYSAGYFGNTPPDEDEPAWNGSSEFKEKGWHPYYNKKGEIVSWYQYAVEMLQRDYKNKWLDKLPTGARPIWLTEEEIKNHPFLKGEQGWSRGALCEVSEPRVNTARALYAYPLAGACWLVPDLPVTAASHILVVPVIICVAIGSIF